MKSRRSGSAEPVLLAPGALRAKAIRLLARRERSREELQQRLAPCCEDPDALVPLLDELEACGWLSEARLAAQLVRLRRPRASAARIRQELARRGVQADTLADSTRGLDAGDMAAALALWQRRFGQPAADRAQRERQLRFLVSRGFSHGMALRVLRIGEGSADREPE
jgi:regulatory protein